MLMMKTYGILEHLEGSETHRSYKGAGGQLVTKRFNCCDLFGNHFNYRHQVDDNNNWCHSPISVERTWATKYWPDRCHAYFLELTEVNENYLWGYLIGGFDVDPQLYFRRQLGWEMVENTLDEETEAGGVGGRWLRSRRETLGDHELVTAPKYCGKCLVDENKWQKVKNPYQKQI